MVRIPAFCSRTLGALVFALMLAPSGFAQEVDAPAPELSGTDLEGKAVALADFEGNVTVLDFWASWCGPCREELPFLVELSEDLTDEPVRFLAINVDEDDASRRALLSSLELDLPFRQLHDPEGRNAESYKLPAMPTTVVIDAQGVVRYRSSGFLPGHKAPLRQAITDLLEAMQ